MSVSFRQSIVFLLGIFFLTTVGIGGIGSYFMMKNAHTVAYQYENAIKPAMYMEDIKSNYWKAHALMLQMALDRLPEQIEAVHAQVLALFEASEKLVEAYRKTDPSGPEEVALFAAFAEKRNRYKAASKRGFELSAGTTYDSLMEFSHFNSETLLPVFYDFTDALDELTEHMLEFAAQSNAMNEQDSRLALTSMGGIFLLAVIILLGTAWLFTNTVTRMLARVTSFASAIARTDFSGTLDATLLARNDEFGGMARALDTMRDNLASAMEALNTTAANLAASNELAQKANAAKTIFLARMSHEMRTPLNAITGMTYVARKASDRAALESSLGKIAASSSHLVDIVNNVLDMAKIEAGKLELTEEAFGLDKLLAKVCAVSSVKMNEKEQTPHVFVKNGLAARFIGDSLRLAQVLTNVLDNASKFSPEKSVISLRVSCPERDERHSRLRFTVEDAGIGLTPEQIERLFVPFEQADGGFTRQFGGTGLGLAICDTLVKLMGGDIRVESEPGKGSRFIITVTLENEQQTLPARLEQAGDGRRLRVFLVGPSQEVREFFTELFQEWDIEVNTAEHGEAAAAWFVEQAAADAPLALFFFDWDTLADGGADFIDAARKCFGNPAFVALAPCSRLAEAESKAAAAGLTRCLAKPLFSSAVIGMVNEITASAEASGEAGGESADFGGKRILLVEDVEINREIVLAYLETTGAGIDEAENGQEAVEKYLSAAGEYDLVLTDVHMPIMDGCAATRRIREEEQARGWARRPIIAMTANAFREDVERCLNAGMDGHLGKPLDVGLMMETLRAHLNP